MTHGGRIGSVQDGQVADKKRVKQDVANPLLEVSGRFEASVELSLYVSRYSLQAPKFSIIENDYPPPASARYKTVHNNTSRSNTS